MDEPIVSQVKAKMQKALKIVSEDLSTIRTGRATPALVENVVISAYEDSQKLKVKEMATITTEGPKALAVAPFDPTVISDMEKGINSSNLGFTATVDSNILRITIPALTAERREEFIKLANVKLEGGRVMIRQIRHEVFSSFKRQFEAKEIAEDDRKRLEKDIQIVTDELMAEIELMRKKKEEELSQV